MVGLTIVLEAQKGGVDKKTQQVINKATMTMMMFNNNKPPSPCSTSLSFHNNFSQFCFPAPTFLEECSLCRQKLLPGKDIYMYKGDRAFCSEECRCRQIFMDEDETLRKEYCSFAAMKPTPSSSPSTTTATTEKTAPSTSDSRHRNSARNRAGGFAY